MGELGKRGNGGGKKVKATMQYKSVYTSYRSFVDVVSVEGGKTYIVSIYDSANNMCAGCVVADKIIAQTVAMPNWDVYQWQIAGDVLQVKDTNSSGSAHHTYISEIE